MTKPVYFEVVFKEEHFSDLNDLNFSNHKMHILLMNRTHKTVKGTLLMSGNKYLTLFLFSLLCYHVLDNTQFVSKKCY